MQSKKFEDKKKRQLQKQSQSNAEQRIVCNLAFVRMCSMSRGRRHPVSRKFVPKIHVVPSSKSMGRPKIKPKPNFGGADYVTTQLVGLASFHTHSNNSSNSVTCAATTDKLGAMAFALADLPSSAATGVFDQYKILEIDLQFRPRSNALNQVNVASPNDLLPGLLVVVDYDDDTALSVITDAQQYDNVVRAQAYEGVRVRFRPTIDPAIFASGAFTGYAIEESDKMWLDINSNTISHYGVKWCAEAMRTSATTSIVWDVWAYYTVGYKNTR